MEPLQQKGKQQRALGSKGDTANDTEKLKSKGNSAPRPLAPFARNTRIKRQKHHRRCRTPPSPSLWSSCVIPEEHFLLSEAFFRARSRERTGGAAHPRRGGSPPPPPQTLPSPGAAGPARPVPPLPAEEEPGAEPPAPPATPTKRPPPLPTETPPAPPPPRADTEGHRTGEPRAAARLRARPRAAPSSLPAET